MIILPSPQKRQHMRIKCRYIKGEKEHPSSENTSAE
jgi:hypothetical protein